MEIKGTKGNDTLTGTDDADVIKGGRGADVIDGRGGADILDGGRGADTFLFRWDQADIDIIFDFEPGKDRIIVEMPDNLVPAYGSELGGFVYTANPEFPAFSGAIAQIDGSPASHLLEESLIAI
jgi:Ca2+-binding RTX toxin-like protein